MANKNVHIVKSDGSWVVKNENSARAVSVHNTQKDAVEAGRELARTKSTVLVVHGSDNRVAQRRYFVSDAAPPKLPRKVLSPAVVNKKNVPSIEKAVASAIKSSRGTKAK